MDLTGKTAIVTGAASGIGAEIVRLFLESGANVVGVDLATEATPTGDLERLTALYPDRLRLTSGDVSEESTAIRYAETAIQAFGRADVMINNAGVAVVKPIHEHTSAEWDRVMNVNVKSIFWSAKALIPIMKRQGGGLFLNTGSISSVAGIVGQGAYGPSKGAVVQLTRQMAVEYAADNIRVNCVCPGTVDTPLLQKAAVDSGDADKFLNGLKSSHPIGRIAAAEEIAQFFRFLASDHARFFTGAILMIDGGFTSW